MPDPVPMLARQTLVDHGEYSCHTVEETQPWQFEPHRHVDFCDLVFVHQGVLKQVVNNRRSTLGRGMMAFVRYGDTHRLWSSGLVMYNLNFREESLRHAAAFLGVTRQAAELLNAPDAPVFETSVSQRSALLLDYQDLLLNQHREGAAQVFRGFLIRWLLCILPKPLPSSPGRLPLWLSQVLTFIEEGVERPVTVPDLAEFSGRSCEHVARCFRSYLGTTPSTAINEARLNRAALLLAHTNRPILDICYSLGYNSPSYFYRLFRRAHGVPPRRYRLEHSVLHQSITRPATPLRETGTAAR